MDKRQIIRMIFSVILPPVMVIALFATAIGAVIIPATEDALMQKKRDMIQAIVMSATSILDKHAQMEKDGLVSLEESQKAALAEMRALRYGVGNKDYLWITDLQPAMVMHPYFPDLEGQLLNNYSDTEGKLFFVEAVEIAGSKGEGYVDYMWPRHDNTAEVVPKLSYIRLFKPWGWVVGSGIYLDDVQQEIRAVTYRLLSISGYIGVIVLLLLLFVIQRGWKSENGRRHAQKELFRSHERYQALAHASGEMLFLTIDGIIAGVNKKACEALGMNEDEVLSRNIAEFIKDSRGPDIFGSIDSEGVATPIETALQGKNGPQKILLSAEHAIVHESEAIMYAGYSMQWKDDPDNGLIIQESLKKSGFGMVLLENLLSGEIISADRCAEGLLMGGSEKPITGMDLRRFFDNGDAIRLFLQLHTDKKAENLLLRLTVGSTVKYLKVWAAVIEDSRDVRGQVSVFLTDATRLHLTDIAYDNILHEFLLPERRISADACISDSDMADAIMNGNFQRTKVILRQTVKTGMNADEVTAATVRSINKIFNGAVQKTFTIIGPPPCSYALLAFGSIGRSEPTLNPDQDTAIIFQCTDQDASNSEYFKHFGRLVTSICEDAGVPPCKAGNNAGNPAWCINEKAWRSQFSTWINTSQPEDLILVNIFFDFRAVAGDTAFTDILRQHILHEVEKRPVFLYNLAQDTLSYKPPSDLFGRIRSDGRAANYINLKGTMLHFVNFARVYSLKYNVMETNTIGRLQALTDARHIPPDTGRDTIDAFKFLLSLRLKNQVAAMEMNFPLENTVILDELGSWDEMMLKKATAQVGILQKRLADEVLQG